MKLLRGKLAQMLMLTIIGSTMGSCVWAQDINTGAAVKSVISAKTTSQAVEATPQPCGDVVAEDLSGLSEEAMLVRETIPMTSPLWVAGSFNFFIFDRHEMTDGDAQGRVAVGKKAVYNRYAIAPYINQNEAPYPVAMVLGNDGTLSIKSGHVNGNIITNNKANVKTEATANITIDEMNVNKDIIDFKALQAKYMTLSYFLALKIPNGTVKVNPYDPNSLELIAPDNPGNRIIFTLPKEITKLGEIKIKNVDLSKNPTIIINSFGNAIGQTGQMTINGDSELATNYAGNIIWNLPFAYTGLSVPVAGTIYGSVLAPSGDFKVAGWGHIEGTFIANSFVSEGSFEGHNNVFRGKIPPVTCPNLAELEYWMSLN